MIDVSPQTDAVYVPVPVILTLIMGCAVNLPDLPPGMRVSPEGIRAAGHFIAPAEILTTAAFFLLLFSPELKQVPVKYTTEECCILTEQ